MAIYRPRTIGDAPEGLERSGGCCWRDFLASRGMGVAQGKKVAPTALRLRRSRRSRSSARSSHHRGHVRRVLNHKSGRRWPPSVPLRKRSKRFGVEKETKEGKRRYRRRKPNRERRALTSHLHAPDAIAASSSKFSEEGRDYLSLELGEPRSASYFSRQVSTAGWRKIIAYALRL
jgi:hypothetical protein